MAAQVTKKPLRRQLDGKLKRIAPAVSSLQARKGWVRTIRESLGMTLRQLARRMGVSHVVVTRLEEREQAGAVTLDVLRRTADAMDCDLVYFFLPRHGLEASVQSQARKAAATMVANVSHSMALEAQSVDTAEVQRQVQDIADELVRTGSKRIWDTPER